MRGEGRDLPVARAPRALALALALVAGCEGTLADRPSGPADDPRNVGPGTIAAAPPMLHRLTRAEYEQTLRDLFADGTTIPTDLPNDTLLHGFSTVGASELTIPPLEVEQYESAANALALAAMADPAQRRALVGCDVATEGTACLRTFVTDFGERAWRRPLEPAEIDALAQLGNDLGHTLGDPWRGAAFALTAILQSPHFLFRVEVGEPDPANPERLRFTSWEMASRLSYFLLGGPPDAALRRAAAAGELVTEEGLVAQVERLGASPRAQASLTRFFAEFMQLDRLASVSKDPTLYPDFSALRGSMRNEVEQIFADVVARDADVREVFSTDLTFVDGPLAQHYDLPAIPGPGELVRATLPESQARGGVLGRAAILSMWAHATLTSPTLRGRFIRANLLCQDIPPPPPGISTELPEGTGEPETLRTRLDRHRTDPQCAGCHSLMDPLGFTLEHFDPVGRYRDLDNGLPVDASADIDGTSVDGAAELGAFLASSDRVGACFARRFYRWASGHLETRAEEPEVRRIEEGFAASGHRMRALLRLVALSPAFRYASRPATSGEE